MSKFIMLLLSCLAINISASAKTEPLLPSLSPIVKKSINAIVNIHVKKEVPVVIHDHGDAGSNLIRKVEGFGSGVLVDASNGYILTNSHIIIKSKEIFVTLHDGNIVRAKIIGSDPATDIAVLKIPPQKIKSIAIGNSDQIQIGDFVIAIGNPFGLGSKNGSNQTVTAGIISALNRSQVAGNGYYDFIQSDVAVNPGNSGGALIDMHGKIIGINTAILVPHGATAAGNVGVSFAIPINMARNIMKQLIEFGSIKRGSLGVIVQNFTPALSASFNVNIQKGAVISQVNPGSPAAKAGLKAGDIITHINGDAIQDSAQVRNEVGVKRIGSSMVLTIVRNLGKNNSKTLNVKVMISESTKAQLPTAVNAPYLNGIQMQDIKEHSPIHGMIEGIQVRGLEFTSPGFAAGLKPGDIIIQANHSKVTSMEELMQVARKSNNEMLVLVLRGSASFYTVLKKEEHISVK